MDATLVVVDRDRRLSQEPPGQTLQATALVHEAYMQLVGRKEVRSDRKVAVPASQLVTPLLSAFGPPRKTRCGVTDGDRDGF